MEAEITTCLGRGRKANIIFGELTWAEKMGLYNSLMNSNYQMWFLWRIGTRAAKWPSGLKDKEGWRVRRDLLRGGWLTLPILIGSANETVFCFSLKKKIFSEFSVWASERDWFYSIFWLVFGHSSRLWSFILTLCGWGHHLEVRQCFSFNILTSCSCQILNEISQTDQKPAWLALPFISKELKDDIFNPSMAVWPHDQDTVWGWGNLSLVLLLLLWIHYLTLIDKTTSLNGCLSCSSREKKRKLLINPRI